MTPTRQMMARVEDAGYQFLQTEAGWSLYDLDDRSEVNAARAKALGQYREMLTARLADPIDGPKYRVALDSLKGKTCVCWCAPQACHGHVIQEFLGEASDKPKAEQHVEPPKPEAPPVQMSLFGDEPVKKTTVYA